MRAVFKKLRLFLGLAWSISPGYIGMLLFTTLVSSGRILLNVILPRYLVDELVGAADPRRLVLFGGLIVASNLLFALLDNVGKRYMDVGNIYMSEMMQEKMAEKIMNVEYFRLETPRYLDLKERAVFAIVNRDALRSLIIHASSALKCIVTLVGLLAVMFTLSPLLVAVLGAIVAVNLLRYARHMKQQWQFYQDIVPLNRKYGYYVSRCYDDAIQKDVRLYDMADMFTGRVAEYNMQMHRDFMAFDIKKGKFLGLYGILNDLQAAIAYVYVGIRTFTAWLGPQISIGQFTMYVSTAISFTTQATELGQSAAELLRVLDFLEPFAEFMALPNEADTGGDAILEGGIESVRFEDVSFHYPESDRLVLKNISFEVRKGEKVSVVGLNGAGKTTLVKLICRLYRPSAGKIYINGRDIYEYEYTSYMRNMAAVFQDFKLFAFSVEENITGRAPGEDTGRAMELLREVGLRERIESLPKGAATLLGKAFDEEGTEFSGGESQKIAIARALYKDASLIILDEPTSALDPLAEAEIYENFNALIGDKTALYISHRMSSSVFCDRILIIDGGTVSDYDTHEALMRKTDGIYYRLFTSQAENYRIEEQYRREFAAPGA